MGLGRRIGVVARARPGLAVFVMIAGSLAAGEPALVMIQSGPGRFEIAAADPTVAHGIAAAAEEGWRLLSQPLALPENFPSPIFLRVVPASELGNDPAAFRVTVEAGGVVSVRIRANVATAGVVRRALVQSLLMRLAVARHGVSPRLNVPLWLEVAGVGWWETRADAAQLDALKQRSVRQTPPPMEAVLGWQRGGEDSPGLADAATWLMTFFQSESNRGREWGTLGAHLLHGEDPLLAVAVSFPGKFQSAETRELWWRTGYHQLCRARTLPTLAAIDCREQLLALARFVFLDANEDADKVVPLRVVLARAGEPVVAAEIDRRVKELERVIPALHPYYRNVGLSLGAAFAARAGRNAKREEACSAFERDWQDATELERATQAALEALERRTAR